MQGRGLLEERSAAREKLTLGLAELASSPEEARTVRDCSSEVTSKEKN
jgi:hypothetical protein